jgi:hypothetical protein
MNRGVGEIQKKRAGLMLPNKFHGLFGIHGLEYILLVAHHGVDDFVIAHQRNRRLALGRRHIRLAIPFAAHVVGVWQTQVMIESTKNREKLRLIADVPFADCLRGISLLLKQIGDGVLLFA